MKTRFLNDKQIDRVIKVHTKLTKESYKYLETSHCKWNSELKTFVVDGAIPKIGRPKKTMGEK